MARKQKSTTSHPHSVNIMWFVHLKLSAKWEYSVVSSFAKLMFNACHTGHKLKSSQFI